MSKNISRKKIRILLSRLVVLIFIVWAVLVMFKQRSLKKDLEAKRSEYELEISEIKNDIELLEDEISDSDSLQFIERVAREELGMVKPREIVVIDKNKKQKNQFKINSIDN